MGPNSISILIVDRSNGWGAKLRERLASLKLEIYSARSRHEAAVFATSHRIDVAVLDDATDDFTADVRAILKVLDVPYIYGATPISGCNLVRLHGCDDEVYGALEGLSA
jgi:CheY-like chemotaxis protein